MLVMEPSKINRNCGNFGLRFLTRVLYVWRCCRCLLNIDKSLFAYISNNSVHTYLLIYIEKKNFDLCIHMKEVRKPFLHDFMLY